ncbi:MAG TPA: hypothetical protein VNV86_10225 [Candidatus Acidoferrum sp.]|jgi:hypothetical protein|nr:hypothetical protein [Candidatus Acidoferrum sp.]
MGKIKAKPPAIHTTHIPEQKPPSDSGVAFSFKHLDLTSEKFSLDSCRENYLHKFLERLKALNGLSIQEIRTNKSRSLRAHPIDWARTTEEKGFWFLNEQLRNLDAWQFEISSNEHGRVHGFFIDRLFYVVWIDPNHLLYA